MLDLRAGIYRNYKGHLYLVIGYAGDANLPGRTVVVYVGLQTDGATRGERITVRTADDFFAVVDPGTGAVVGARGWDGREPCPVARFTYVGPTVPGPAPDGGEPRG